MTDQKNSPIIAVVLAAALGLGAWALNGQNAQPPVIAKPATPAAPAQPGAVTAPPAGIEAPVPGAPDNPLGDDNPFAGLPESKPEVTPPPVIELPVELPVTPPIAVPETPVVVTPPVVTPPVVVPPVDPPSGPKEGAREVDWCKSCKTQHLWEYRGGKWYSLNGHTPPKQPVQQRRPIFRRTAYSTGPACAADGTCAY